jgi:hypothetical protein
MRASGWHPGQKEACNADPIPGTMVRKFGTANADEMFPEMTSHDASGQPRSWSALRQRRPGNITSAADWVCPGHSAGRPRPSCRARPAGIVIVCRYLAQKEVATHDDVSGRIPDAWGRRANVTGRGTRSRDAPISWDSTNHPDRVTPTHQPWRNAQSVSKEGSQAAAPS